MAVTLDPRVGSTSSPGPDLYPGRMTAQSDELSIGQVAERTGLSVHALRFYEREGIFLSRVRRAAGGRRVYTEDDVDWLTLCTILRGAAMPLEDIRRYTELVRPGDRKSTPLNSSH